MVYYNNIEAACRRRGEILLATTNPILIAAAVIPAIWLLIRIYKADRLEKEPIGLIVQLVLQGVFSTILAGIAEELGDVAVDILFGDGSFLYNLIFYFLVVGLSEEGFKYLLLKRKTWRSPNFNCQFDGVVYAATVSLGFALWENIGYVAQFGLGNALIRAVTAVPGHACFGVFMGVFYGMAKRWEQLGDRTRSTECRYLAVLVPTFLHGCYDFIATAGGLSLVFIVFVAAMFLTAVRMVRKQSRDDRYITYTRIYYGRNY